MLPANVETTSDLMSIALQAEREAVRRYSELAVKMRKAGNDSAAALFERMVSEEQEHEHLLLEWMAQEGIDENPDIPPVRWRDPNISTTYNDEARDPYQSSPYRALAFAVHNEEIAFRFYTHVTAESKNKAVRKYAEVLAREELGHAALLRAERRRAYHAERHKNKAEPMLEPRKIHNESDLLTVAIQIDRYLLGAMNCIAKNTPQITALINDTQQQISNNEQCLNSKPAASEDTITMLDQLKLYRGYLESNDGRTGTDVKRLWTCCDRSFAFYDAIVETAAALDRIGFLKQVFGNLSISDEPAA